MNALALLFADGRFPSGGHAHSHGVEAAIGLGDVRTPEQLRRFLDVRLHTVGRVDAAFTAASCSSTPEWNSLDVEYAARSASPVLRAASRSLGRQLLRAGERVWPSPAYATLRAAAPPEGPFHPLALGAVAHVAGLTPHAAALVCLHQLAGGITTAAVRLLGLDPFEVTSLLAATTPDIERLADEAAAAAGGPTAQLPARVDLMADVLAEHHATWEVRLFAS